MQSETARLGPFALQTLLGRGGMGEVWRAQHVRQEVDVAVKVLKGPHVQDPWYLQAFREEIRVAAGLDHPNIVAVLDFGEVTAEESAASGGRVSPGAPWAAMELVPGRPLDDLCGRMSWGGIVRVLSRLLEALAHAHARGVIHRDIKPGNVLLHGEAVKLTDFGLARRMAQSSAGVVDRSVVGTLHYMAPEQLEGEWRDHGPWTDLYALGCLAHALVGGEAPQSSMRRSELVNARLRGPPAPPVARGPIPEGFASWLARLMRSEPEARFQRAADAMRVLDDLLAPDVRPPTPRSWRSTAPPTPDRWLAGAGLNLYGVRSIRLVGREAERDALWAALRETESEGAPRVAVIRGPVGCGKSVLGRWLCERAHELGAATPLSVTHDLAGGPTSGLGAMVGRTLRCVGMRRGEVLARISAWLRARGRYEEGRALALTELICPEASEVDRNATGSVRFRSAAERYETIRIWLSILSAERPVILWVDDSQWGMETLGFVAWLLQAANPGPILIALAVQGEALSERLDQTTGVLREAALLQDLERSPQARSLALGKLDPVTHRALIRELLGLETATAARIEARTAGDPLFAVQLVQGLVERGELEIGPGGFRMKPGVQLDLPDDIHRVWASRIINLVTGRPRAWQGALEVAAALGRGVDGAEWSAACQTGKIEAPRELVEIMLRQGLAVSVGGDASGSWSWVHEMLRASVLRRARAQRRLKAVNLACARALSARGAPSERVGRHMMEAGDRDRGMPLLLRGVREAIQAGDPSRASAALHHWHHAMGGRPPDDPLWGEGWLLQGWLCLATGRHQEAIGWIQQAERESRRRGWGAVRAEAGYLLARLAYYEGDMALAVQRLEAIDGAPEMSRLLRGRVRSLWADALMQRGERDAARRTWRLAIEDCKATRNLVGAANCLMGLGFDALNRGERDEAEAALQRARRYFTEGGSRTGLSACLNTLGDVARHRGDLERAEADYRESLAIAEGVGAGSAVFARANLGLVLSARGETRAARKALTRAMREAGAQGRKGLLGALHICVLPCMAADEDWRGFSQHLQRGREILNRAGILQIDVPDQAQLGGDAALKAGQLELAREALGFAADQLEGLGRKGEAQSLRRRIKRIRDS